MNAYKKRLNELNGLGYDAILIGYGLCSNGTLNITSKYTPLVFLKPMIVLHFSLGSRKRYREIFNQFPVCSGLHRAG